MCCYWFNSCCSLRSCCAPAGSSASREVGPAPRLGTSQDLYGREVPAQKSSDSATLHGAPCVESVCPRVSDEMTATVSKHGQAEGVGALPGREAPSSGVRPRRPIPGAGPCLAGHLSGRAGPLGRAGPHARRLTWDPGSRTAWFLASSTSGTHHLGGLRADECRDLLGPRTGWPGGALETGGPGPSLPHPPQVPGSWEADTPTGLVGGA